MGADQNIDWATAAASTLDWWREMGVDVLVDDAPCDWFAAPVLPVARAPVAPTPAVPEPAMPDTIADFAAWRLGPKAPEAAWPGRRLGAEGDPASSLAIVTDWPEREDQAAGRLLSGEEGRLLDRMLAAIGLTRDEVYLVPVATARPPGGRVDDAGWTALGGAARRHLVLARPARVLLLGDAASRAVLQMNCRDARETTHAVNYDGGKARMVASFHPRLLLARPTAKADAWRDLLRLMGDGE